MWEKKNGLQAAAWILTHARLFRFWSPTAEGGAGTRGPDHGPADERPEADQPAPLPQHHHPGRPW